MIVKDELGSLVQDFVRTPVWGSNVYTTRKCTFRMHTGGAKLLVKNAKGEERNRNVRDVCLFFFMTDRRWHSAKDGCQQFEFLAKNELYGSKTNSGWLEKGYRVEENI